MTWTPQSRPDLQWLTIHQSSCAVHSEPAYRKGACNCFTRDVPVSERENVCSCATCQPGKPMADGQDDGPMKYRADYANDRLVRDDGSDAMSHLPAWTAGDVSTPYPPLDILPAATAPNASNNYGYAAPKPVAAPAPAAMNPSHAHEATKNRGTNMWAVTHADGMFKEYHHGDEAEAIAAFWSGDTVRAQDARKRAFIRRGLMRADV